MSTVGLSRIVFIAIGGAVGSVMRYLLNGVIQSLGGGLFPYGTMVVNIVGCLGFGYLFGLMEQRGLPLGMFRHLIFIGFFGAFTTFSTFTYESWELWHSGQYLRTILNLGGQLGGGLLGMSFGIMLALWQTGR